MEDKQKMEENRQKIIDAKIRYLLNLGPEVDISKLTKRVTVEDQMKEVARLEKEIFMLGQPQQEVEREKDATLSLKNLEMESEAVMKEITAMRKEHYDKINFGKHCQVLTFMVDQVSLRLQQMKIRKNYLSELKGGTRGNHDKKIRPE